MPQRYRFLLRPWWIATHVLLIVAVVVMVKLGFWQLDRLDEKQELADTLELRIAEPAVAVDSLVGPDDGTDAADTVQYRTVTATGTYLVDEEVLVANRTQDGRAGYWVVTPLRVSPDESVAVVRGFVDIVVGEEGVPVEAVAPPENTVTVTGWVQATAEQGAFGGTDDRPGQLERYNRLDLDRLAEQVSTPLDPVAVVAIQQQPATVGDGLSPVPRPEPDLGPHLGYAGQWFMFALVFALGYPFMLRRQARQYEERGRAGEGEPGEDPSPNKAVAAPNDPMVLNGDGSAGGAARRSESSTHG